MRRHLCRKAPARLVPVSRFRPSSLRWTISGSLGLPEAERIKSEVFKRNLASISKESNRGVRKGPVPNSKLAADLQKKLDIEYHREAAAKYDRDVTDYFHFFHVHSLHPWICS